MRCYFMRGGHIQAYIPLTDGTDEAMIEQAAAAFKVEKERYDGFEVWRRDQCLYRFPANLTAPSAPFSPSPSSAAEEPSQDASQRQR